LFQHVLTAVLKANEKRLGFQSAATYLGYVQPEEFRQRLKQGMQFKDPTVPGGHGEFTHRIQWYLITKELEPPKGGWVDFYKWIGSVKHTKPVEGDEEDWGELGLWVSLSTETRAAGKAMTCHTTPMKTPIFAVLRISTNT
jgi:Family of unknown function (DUF5636)